MRELLSLIVVLTLAHTRDVNAVSVTGDDHAP